jgi:hypothetical protein
MNITKKYALSSSSQIIIIISSKSNSEKISAYIFYIYLEKKYLFTIYTYIQKLFKENSMFLFALKKKNVL